MHECSHNPLEYHHDWYYFDSNKTHAQRYSSFYCVYCLQSIRLMMMMMPIFAKISTVE